MSRAVSADRDQKQRWAPPLSGTHVVDLCRGLAGAYAGKLLADAGATVWKVEPPEGDPRRRWSVSGESLDEAGDGVLFRMLHASKRSVVLDLEESSERDRLLGLYARCDLVLEDGAPGEAESRSIGYPALRACNPGRAGWPSRPSDRPVPGANGPRTSSRCRPGAGRRRVMGGRDGSRWLQAESSVSTRVGSTRRLAR